MAEQKNIYEGRGADNVVKASMFPVQGVDCSKYQGDFNWAKACHEGKIGFGFARATVGYGDTDSKFLKFWEQMCDVPIMRGAYHFAYPKSVATTIEKDAEDEANYFAETLHRAEDLYGHDDGCMMPPVLDYEQKTSWSPQENKAWINSFILTLQTAVRRGVIIYTGDNVWRTQLDGDPWLTKLPLWVPHYSNGKVPGMKPWESWAFWQWSGGGNGDVYQNLTGKPFPGVVGNGSVDVNAWWGTAGQLAKIGNDENDIWLNEDGTVGKNPFAFPNPQPQPDQERALADLVVRGCISSQEAAAAFRRIRNGGRMTVEGRLADGGAFILRCEELRVSGPKEEGDLLLSLDRNGRMIRSNDS